MSVLLSQWLIWNGTYSTYMPAPFAFAVGNKSFIGKILATAYCLEWIEEQLGHWLTKVKKMSTACRNFIKEKENPWKKTLLYGARCLKGKWLSRNATPNRQRCWRKKKQKRETLKTKGFLGEQETRFFLSCSCLRLLAGWWGPEGCDCQLWGWEDSRWGRDGSVALMGLLWLPLSVEHGGGRGDKVPRERRVSRASGKTRFRVCAWWFWEI